MICLLYFIHSFVLYHDIGLILHFTSAEPKGFEEVFQFALKPTSFVPKTE
jgi:hypothetical protein